MVKKLKAGMSVVKVTQSNGKGKILIPQDAES